MHTTLHLSCLLLLAAAMPGCDRDRDKSAGPERTVKVGFLVSGDRASYADAAAIAVDEINDGGGLLGRTLELVIRMGIEEPSVSVEAAEQMIVDAEVIALVGPNRSSHAVVVGETAQRHGRPMITTSATNPDVTRAGGFVFMAAFTDLFQGGVMARFAREELGLEAVAVLTCAARSTPRGSPRSSSPGSAVPAGRWRRRSSSTGGIPTSANPWAAWPRRGRERSSSPGSWRRSPS